MKTQYFAVRSAITLALLAVPSVFGGTVIVDFTAFPGADNILGTGDDVALNLTSSASGGVQTRFTNEFAFLSGGVGFVVDSLCCTAPQGIGVATIANGGAGNLLAQARPDIDSTAYSFGSLNIRFVSSADGTTPVNVYSVDVRFGAGASGTVDFFHGTTEDRYSVSLPTSGSLNLSYSDVDLLGEIRFTGTGGINLLEFDSTTAVSPPAATPEPGAFLLAAGGFFLLSGLLRKRAV